MGEIERTMSADEFREWIVFSSVEPFGETRADMRAAVVAREVRQMLQAGKKRYALMDFMPVVKMEHDRTEANNAALLSAKINAYMFSRPNVIVKPAQRRQA